MLTKSEYSWSTILCCIILWKQTLHSARGKQQVGNEQLGLGFFSKTAATTAKTFMN